LVKDGEGREHRVTKHLIDTDVYVDFLQSGKFHAEIARIYAEYTPGIYFSSVVAEELLAGAISPAERKNVETFYLPFERVGRVVTPTHLNWKETGNVLAQIFRANRPPVQSSLRSLPIA
jgi:predicted nucleic acid-binding protein